MSRMKRFIALLLALLSVLSLAACGTADDNKDDYVKGTSAGKELGQTVAADDIFTLNCNKGYSMNPLIATALRFSPTLSANGRPRTAQAGR